MRQCNPSWPSSTLTFWFSATVLKLWRLFYQRRESRMWKTCREGGSSQIHKPYMLHQHDFPHQHPVVVIVMVVQVPRPACWGARQGESGSKAVGFTQGLSWVGCSRVPQLTWFTRGSVGRSRWMLSTCKGKHSCVRNVLHLWFVLQIYQISLLPFSVDCCKFQLVF